MFEFISEFFYSPPFTFRISTPIFLAQLSYPTIISCNFFGFFSALVGSILSLLIRIQLTYPGSVLVGENYQAYNVIITMHAMLMIFMFVMPVLIGGFGNFIVPLHLGIPDVAFPRVNALSFWLLPTSLALMYLSMLEKLGPGTG